MALVLIIEDEPMLRSSMARGLSRVPGVEIAEAGSLDEALARIDTTPPRLILSDIDLPGRSGIELLGELGRRGLRVPIVFISAYLKAYGQQIPPHADVEVREKPVSLDELRKLVTSRIGEPAREAGGAPFAATDYLQLACVGRHSVEIVVQGQEANGTIAIVAGQVWSARDSTCEGLPAFRRLVFAAGAVVNCVTLRSDPGPRTLEGDWETLLLDAAREEDEARRAPLDVSLSDACEPERTFDAVWQEAVAALRAKDYSKALQAFLEAQRLKPEDAWVAVNLQRLRRMGYAAEG